MTRKTCDKCKFFDLGGNDGVMDHGVCRRYPPKVLAIDDIHKGRSKGQFLPSVDAETWCGEWVLKESLND